MCQHAPKKLNKCLLKDDCPYAHNASEENYHPDKYKTKMCSSCTTGKECEFGNFCSYAHSEEEL
jgi:hypothetical protein